MGTILWLISVVLVVAGIANSSRERSSSDSS